MAEEKSLDAVEKVLGNPVSAELSETALKVRRNLLLTSLLSIVVVIGVVRLDPSSTVLGFKFIGLTDSVIRTGLLLVTAYLFVHFLWYVLESVVEWRLRVTGTRLAFLTGAKFTSKIADYPDDPRQSTLYSWWLDQAKRIGGINKKIESVDDAFRPCEERLRVLLQNPGDAMNLQNTLNAITETRGVIVDLKRSVECVQETFSSQRIPGSLQRFDNWFQLVLRSENLRWLLIDALAPLIAGGTALFLLFRHP